MTTWKTLTTAAKRVITADWAAEFPGLGVYRSMMFGRIVGPVLQGIVLDRSGGGEYYTPVPFLHCLALAWSSDAPALHAQGLGVAGESVRVVFHDSRYASVAGRIREEALLSFSGDLDVADVVRAYERTYGKGAGPYDRLSYLSRAAVLAWCGEAEWARRIVDDAVGCIAGWPSDLIERMGGLAAWKESALAAISSQDAVRRMAEQEAERLGLIRLPRAQLRC